MRKGRRHGDGSADGTADGAGQDRRKRKTGLSFGGEGSLRNGARVRRNVRVAARRTSVSLEVAIWDALADICAREEMAIDAVCDAVESRRNSDSLASSLRTFSLLYFRLSTSRWEKAAARPGNGSVSDGPQHGFPTIFEEALSRFESARAVQGDHGDDQSPAP
ncbi:ribbon-helix-helix domain-containing protein [Oceanibaculum indicum]|uniref:ribbon-helix-helix domain-containing protein n=1 Tax=Oceanibaculum indicum TaxID=526216 RepID=UPI0009FFAAF4|nr:ribbon-helix-helix domain-containing protein [Oceanibaculum indicum]